MSTIHELSAASSVNIQQQLQDKDIVHKDINKDIDKDMEGGAYTFHYLPEATFTGYSTNDTKNMLSKWDLMESTYMIKFRYDETLDLSQSTHIDGFLLDLVNSQAFRQHAQVLAANRRASWNHVAAVTNRIDRVVKQELRSTVISMEFFDRLYSQGVAQNETGLIRKCFDEYVDGITIQDQLRKTILMEDSDVYCIFNEQDRDEVLFKLFAHLAIGGGMCQFEDSILPYLEATKLIYKDLISVRKNKNTQAIEVCSHVYEIRACETGVGHDSKNVLFPSNSPHHACYVSIDTIKKQVTMFYSGFVSFW